MTDAADLSETEAGPATPQSRVGSALLVAALVFVLAWGSQRLTGQFGRPPVLWPANAILLAFLIRSPIANWPGLIAGGLLGDLAAGLMFEGNLILNLGIQVGNAVEALLCAAGLRRLVGPQLDLGRLRHLVGFAAVTVAAAFVVSVGDRIFAGLLGRSGPLATLAGWSLSDALGLMILTPTLLALERRQIARLFAGRRLVRTLFPLLGLGAATVTIFAWPDIHMRAFILAGLVFVAFEAEAAGVALGLLVVSLAATLVLIWSPVGLHGRPNAANPLLTQLFLLVCAATAFPVAASISRRRELDANLVTRAASLAQSEARYRLLAEASRDIILHTDGDGTILYASPSVRQLGYDPEQAIGGRAWSAIHPDDLEELLKRTSDLWSGKPADATELRQQRVRRADGSWVWLEGNPTVIRDPQGLVTGVVTSFRDITAHKTLEAELERKREEAEAATTAKTEFLANMSHEIRTPLTAIIGFAGALENIEPLPPDATYCARKISTGGQALLTVVNDILDFSKIEAGQVELDPRPFDPAEFLVETIELVEAQAAAKGLAVDALLVGELPPAVLADGARLRQILLNLLTNAIKFTSEGEVVVEAGFDPSGGGRLELSVRDTGVGIPAEQQARLFERFSQADASITRRFGGTGLGLAICKRLAEVMGGSIEVESEPGKGSTFHVTVAAAPAAAADIVATAGSAPAEDAPPARILVVDDVAANREVVRVLLSVLGHELVEASGGREGVEKASESAFDLILMDIQMPEMDGLAATRAIRASLGPNRHTPIVALSADVLDLHRKTANEAGMDDHVAKPINPQELFAKVAYWSTQKSSSEEDFGAPEFGRR